MSADCPRCGGPFDELGMLMDAPGIHGCPDCSFDALEAARGRHAGRARILNQDEDRSTPDGAYAADEPRPWSAA